MDKKLLNELEILHELSENESINQRHLSMKLGITAGLVNLYLKRLANKGYIKIAGIKPRRLKYFVTPKGIAEKSRLTYEFALISYKYFKTATDEIRNALATIEKEVNEGVIVYGCGEGAKLCLQIIKEFNIKVIGVVDDNMEDKKFLGHPIVPREVLQNLIFDKIIIAVPNGDEQDKAKTLIEAMGIDAKKICQLFDMGRNDIL